MWPASSAAQGGLCDPLLGTQEPPGSDVVESLLLAVVLVRLALPAGLLAIPGRVPTILRGSEAVASGCIAITLSAVGLISELVANARTEVALGRGLIPLLCCFLAALGGVGLITILHDRKC